jgi:hypothetical protein
MQLTRRVSRSLNAINQIVAIGGEVVDLMNRRIDNGRMTEPEIINIFADVCEVSLEIVDCPAD